MTTPFSPPVFGGPRPTQDRPSDDWEFVKVLVARWRLLVVMPIVCGIIAGLITLVVPPTFTSTTTFVSASQRDITASLGAFANVATQLGVGIPSNPTTSPQFYGDVLRSREIVNEVLQTRMPDPRSGRATDSVALVELYAKKKSTPAIRDDDGIARLLRASSVSVNPRTSIIELHVSSRYAATAAFTARRFVSALNRFNLETRQSEAHRRRQFVGDRLKEAQDSLSRAERAQQDFLLANRGDLRSSPTLDAQYERLQRQLQTYQDLYSGFRREFETARVDEVNDTPVITVIDTAAVPIKRSSPRMTLTILAGAMFGLLAAIGLLLTHGYFDKLRRQRPGDYDQFRELRRIFLRTLGVRRANAA
jgi:uncharacterized protein involved in exopolysaccharide biosynthesis